MTRHLFFFISLLALLLMPSITSAQDDGPPITYDARWDGVSRFNIFVMGMDRRPGARNNLNARTDVNLIVSFAPAERRIGVLAIPRDLHLGLIENGQLARMNTLMVEGEARQEGYGPYFAMDTIRYNLGLEIDAYVAFDFTAFITLINAIGGVPVDVRTAISDPTYPDMNYGYDPFFLSAGPQVLDGSTALKYVRTRHMDNDFMRGQRQLDVLAGVRQRLSDPGLVQMLIGQLPQLMTDLDGHLYTNLPPEEMVYVGLAMLQAEQLDMTVLDEDYSFEYTRPNGVTVWVPDRALLPALLTQLFGEAYYD